jgi:syntaxin 16
MTDVFWMIEKKKKKSRTSLMAVEGINESAIDRRDREITSIAESIADLAGLFRDLNIMVIDQGTLLDRVDYNIEQMAYDVRGAVEELETATKFVLFGIESLPPFSVVFRLLTCM